MQNAYSADKIKILEGLEAVRLRPGMYIGSTGTKGLHHILWEIVDNGIDEVSNGYGDTVQVVLYPDGSASVEDNGRGIPTDIHPKAKVSGVEVVFTQLHAGGKFDSENYNYSGGLHGVGASVTNALTEWLVVEVYKKTIYKMSFKSYVDKKSGKIYAGIPNGPLENTGVATKKHGSYVRFKPDKTAFETVEFNAETIIKRMRELAFLNKGIKLVFVDMRSGKAEPLVFCYEGGIYDYVKYLNEGNNTLIDSPIYGYQEVEIAGTRETVKVEFALQHTDGYNEIVLSFVNNIPTHDGGKHEEGFKSGLTRVLNDYARTRGHIKDKDENFLGEDFRKGMTAIVSIKMKNAQFEGQTKGKLGNPEVKGIVEGVIVEAISNHSKNKKNVADMDKIIKKAIEEAGVRKAIKRAKDVARAKSSADSAKLVGKLADCSSRKAALNEVFIVEGDSAGGSAKQGRDRQHQAILPLRGKPVNAEKKRIEQILDNTEIRTIISALGTGIGDDFKMKDLNYDKIIILSDADQDGAHIRAILLTFFYRYMRPLIQEGHVYIGMPPLYKVFKKDVVEYAYDDKELKRKIEIVGRGYQLQRYKGLGEMNPSQLWETTLNPQTRMLMRVTLEDIAEAERLIPILMGSESEGRKAYIQTFADFNKTDDFEAKTEN